MDGLFVSLTSCFLRALGYDENVVLCILGMDTKTRTMHDTVLISNFGDP
jgi:hypothetical protein